VAIKPADLWSSFTDWKPRFFSVLDLGAFADLFAMEAALSSFL
jgi:hypothetical protein